MGKYMNLMADWAFKRVFGSEDNKECLITFLNGLFEGEFRIKDVKFQNTEQICHNKYERGVIFDVKCITEDGRHIIVEMQKREQKFFVDRALFYSAKAITSQAKRGEWDYHLAPVYTICFMNFKAETSLPQQFRTDVGLGVLNEEIHKGGTSSQKSSSKNPQTFRFSSLKYGFEKVRIVYLQLPFFKKKECVSIFDCWIYVIKNMERLIDMPFVKKYPVFRMLAEIGDLRKLSPEDREKYDEDIKVMRDLYATRKFELEKQEARMKKAMQKATAKGLAKGLAEGRAEGRVEGRIEGRIEGRNSRSLEIAKNLLSLGVAEDVILHSTGLSAEELAKMKN